jgi:hypothetical protein
MIGTALDALDPIEAVALHDGHPELMPAGADDAAITRGLADRLAGVDLIEPATRRRPSPPSAAMPPATTPARVPISAGATAIGTWPPGTICGWPRAGPMTMPRRRARPG